jgi:hypothetical protein
VPLLFYGDPADRVTAVLLCLAVALISA